MSEERGAGQSQPQPLSVACIRSPHYRVILVDGAWGGVRPEGLILVDVYSQTEHFPTPVQLMVDPESGGVRDVPHEGPDVLREYEARLILRPKSAFELGLWLIDQSVQADPSLDSAGYNAPAGHGGAPEDDGE